MKWYSMFSTNKNTVFGIALGFSWDNNQYAKYLAFHLAVPFVAFEFVVGKRRI